MSLQHVACNIFFKTSSFKDGEYELKCESNECFRLPRTHHSNQINITIRKTTNCLLLKLIFIRFSYIERRFMSKTIAFV